MDFNDFREEFLSQMKKYKDFDNSLNKVKNKIDYLNKFENDLMDKKKDLGKSYSNFYNGYNDNNKLKFELILNQKIKEYNSKDIIHLKQENMELFNDIENLNKSTRTMNMESIECKAEVTKMKEKRKYLSSEISKLLEMKKALKYAYLNYIKELNILKFTYNKFLKEALNSHKNVHDLILKYKTEIKEIE